MGERDKAKMREDKDLKKEMRKSKDGNSMEVKDKKRKNADTNDKEWHKEAKDKKHKKEQKHEESMKEKSSDELKQVRDADKKAVTVLGMEGLLPMEDFSAFAGSLGDALCKGFSQPTPIQAWCWPALATGRDVIGIAETGSGKTLAFSLPLLQALQPGDKHVSVLVLAPTRELALQTQQVVSKACSSLCLYGGVSRSEQIRELKQLRPRVVIGTPGRLIDLMEDERAGLKLERVAAVVLDEADRMLDLGFSEAIARIMQQLPSQRQTIMFSATWPPSIQSMAARYLQNAPIKIVVGRDSSQPDANNEMVLRASATVEQRVEVLAPGEKESRLLALLKQYYVPSRKNRIIIFALYKKEADRLEQLVRRSGYPVAGLHGDKPQVERTRCLDAFRAGTCPLLVATDVAARGLDIPAVEFVINFTFPLTIEDYVHRVGRTGRAGASGIAHTLFTELDKALSGNLINVLKQAGAPVPDSLMAFGTTTKKRAHKDYGAHYKEIDPTVKASHMKFDD